MPQNASSHIGLNASKSWSLVYFLLGSLQPSADSGYFICKKMKTFEKSRIFDNFGQNLSPMDHKTHIFGPQNSWKRLAIVYKAMANYWSHSVSNYFRKPMILDFGGFEHFFRHLDHCVLPPYPLKIQKLLKTHLLDRRLSFSKRFPENSDSIYRWKWCQNW